MYWSDDNIVTAGVDLSTNPFSVSPDTKSRLGYFTKVKPEHDVDDDDDDDDDDGCGQGIVDRKVYPRRGDRVRHATIEDGHAGAPNEQRHDRYRSDTGEVETNLHERRGPTRKVSDSHTLGDNSGHYLPSNKQRKMNAVSRDLGRLGRSLSRRAGSYFSDVEDYTRRRHNVDSAEKGEASSDTAITSTRGGGSTSNKSMGMGMTQGFGSLRLFILLNLLMTGMMSLSSIMANSMLTNVMLVHNNGTLNSDQKMTSGLGIMSSLTSILSGVAGGLNIFAVLFVLFRQRALILGKMKLAPKR